MMTKASQSRLDRKAGLKNVLQMPGKEGLRLTEEEQLRFENYTLKMQTLQDRWNTLVQQRIELCGGIGKRLGISMGEYNINVDTGALIPLNPKTAETIPDGPEISQPEPAGEG